MALHVPIHETIYCDSSLENVLIDAKLISEDAAIVHFWSRLPAGTAHPAGPQKVETGILAVLTRQSGAWYRQALENVTLTNPRTGEPIMREC